ncbi:unnamed protein product [Rotaria magnacalcarata]|uniref:DUF488 domain-containing protein n=1 Tax=Rotaria magnacalcarata TaxID=392030 RepID=A0A815FZL6_9BILA|nr:unnamed protein product [Rotaria magnacalcarata]CAF1331912.1 unnamed protein product [Rotaria magnacalcarata]CAF1935299.1 unnamed protein product [Rotaria magnacalcarata]CAF1956214.1 unnamed protein product [Rotaria magnacalcarata]CAF2159645.1 unnamed protein product [Rotaria magnacalcarata]
MAHTIYTIGHSYHDLSNFFSILKLHNIDQIVDIRRSPRSASNPHFNIDQLKEECSLSRSSFKYSFQGDILGGRRRRCKSIATLNNGLLDRDSHAYADHMQRIEFHQCVNELVLSSLTSSLVLMCSENNPEQCHRSLLADYLCLIHNSHVVHILFNGETCAHQVNTLAQVNNENNTCIYPGLSSN